MTEINKSIIFGNEFTNNYGKFLPLCSSITALEQVDQVVSYLRGSAKFAKFNRYVYAYRVEELPSVFVTQDRPPKPELQEGMHEDRTIEGSGQKLLYMLQKFNIRNVLSVVVIEQKDVLMRFDYSNYRVIVEKSKELLNELYQKVFSY
jgi:hypothetical protein